MTRRGRGPQTKLDAAAARSARAERSTARRPYAPPRLVAVGRLEQITLGSIGTFPESGGGFLRGT